MTKQEFSKTVRIYKSHKLRNGFISVTYADILGPNTISTENKVEIEDKGGALTSLYRHLCPESFIAEEAAAHFCRVYKEELSTGEVTPDGIYEWWVYTRDQYPCADYDLVEKTILNRI